MTCEAANCTDTARIHVLFRAGRHAGTASVCGTCLLSILTGCATAYFHRVAHVADHPLEPQCRHPESRWVDDHCEIDGLELLEDIETLEGVPA